MLHSEVGHVDLKSGLTRIGSILRAVSVLISAYFPLKDKVECFLLREHYNVLCIL